MILSKIAHSDNAVEEEFRSQNGLNAPLPLTGVRINQSGIQTGAGLVDHQIYDLVGVLNPIIQTLLRR
ncbi:hypothetical protein [Nostoc sp. FACHB-133]|uniref:hypothetical protein n=1 Tax=Nostoc sp. FACHB-133 TaxID=2692835 RepID=UPI0016834F8A|nr:hypothetical protein [Nostoc sp. FACHB-133]MBD2527213.1 hypothetical protein [Nostoc sp. FACHB-133]